MKPIAMLLVVLVVVGFTVIVSGCTQQTTISGPEEAQETLRDISQDVSELENTLTDIEQSLG